MRIFKSPFLAIDAEAGCPSTPDLGAPCGTNRLTAEHSNILGVVVVMTTTSIRPKEPVHRGRLSSWGKAIAWVALAAFVVMALVVATPGISAEFLAGSPGYDAIGGHFNLNMVPVKHPVPDAGVYCAGISWFSAPLPDPQLVAVEVNAAPNAAAHGAALRLYNDLADGRSTANDLAILGTTYACPKGG